MQLGLLALTMVFLSSMGDSDVTKPFKARRQRRVSGEVLPSCPKGCERCSEYNGCLKCKAKLFIYFVRSNISQVGVCLASCPTGYFGMRIQGGNNRCSQCEPDCDMCFERKFCIKCKEGLYVNSGKCSVSCPSGLHPANDTMECVECELSEWSQWGSCVKRNKTCGFRKGTQSRVRLPLRPPRTRGTPSAAGPSQTCPPQTDRRKCVVPKTPCPRENRTKGGRPVNGPGGGGGGGGRRRKGQSRTTVVPSEATSSVT
ncbi:R-spondin-1 [Syngnathus acus]|uniref:R-spondin-1 n=1 Tax=Syngnathus acus TaxID=161584 RepID=UPI00188635E4|nr:R-spondin-1 [Syngnathus acus]XP_037130696.1 R-spondin-1 [Syngnathus acus]XP_037130698.1 R-spondin-1 [Syngnathus acus]